MTESTIDIGEYCRRVEEHLGRVNEGHIVRIVGPAFELVRSWAIEGIPLGIVFHGIERKAERHRAGRSRRPLRLEFCEGDVRETFDRWRRAVGLPASVVVAAASADGAAAAAAAPPSGDEDGGRRPSLSKHLDRAIDRLSRASGRLDLPDAFRDVLSARLGELVALREAARTARGDARTAIADRLPAIDDAMVAAARAALPAETITRLQADAESDLAAYRSRLSAEAWQRSVARAADRLVRDQLGLPTLTLDDI